MYLFRYESTALVTRSGPGERKTELLQAAENHSLINRMCVESRGSQRAADKAARLSLLALHGANGAYPSNGLAGRRFFLSRPGFLDLRRPE